MVRHILVGVDGSEPAKKAAVFAHDLAQQTQARITLLFVLEPPRMVPFGPLESFALSSRGPSDEELERVRRLLEEIAADLPRAQVDKVVEYGGHAADVLCAFAERQKVDLIVVGARGLAKGGRWLLGSVSDRVVQHAGRPVTIVH